MQQYSYQATFPLLLNIHGQPTYFMALKDASNLVKMYAMVNVQQYQIVSTGATVAAAETNYLKNLAEASILPEDGTGQPAEEPEAAEPVTVTGDIQEIRSAVVEGNTLYFLRLEGREQWYVLSVSDCLTAAVLNPGDRVALKTDPAGGELVTVYEAQLLKAAPAA